MSELKISVIVPTYNRLSSLKDQLNALMSQTIPVDDYEVLIVNDGSIDGTHKYLDEIAEFYTNLRVFHHQNGGPAKARNTALRVAKGYIIAFTDDDCIVDAKWLSTILDQWSSSIVGLQGATYTDLKRVTPLTHQIHNLSGHNSVPTCNAAYNRELLLEIGGFDESFPSPHNEDADVSWRMQRFGKVKFCTEMRVYHPPRLDAFKKVSKRMKIMESEFTLYRKNPALYKTYRDEGPLRHIYGEVFFKNIGYHFLSKVKLWRKPKFMLQGMLLAIIWWLDLVVKFPNFFRMSRYSSQ